MTLQQVKTLAKQGKNAEARAMLKLILQSKPTADAWYLAALLSEDSESQQRCLQRALMYDPRHHDARRALNDLKQDINRQASGIPAGGFAGTVALEMQNFGMNRPYLRPIMSLLTPTQRMILAAGTLVMLVIVLVALLGTLTQTGGSAPDDVMRFVSAANLPDHFSASGFAATTSEITPNLGVFEQYAVTIPEGDQVSSGMVYVYPPGAPQIPYFRARDGYGLFTHNQFILEYPTALLPETLAALQAALQSLPPLP